MIAKIDETLSLFDYMIVTSAVLNIVFIITELCLLYVLYKKRYEFAGLIFHSDDIYGKKAYFAPLTMISVASKEHKLELEGDHEFRLLDNWTDKLFSREAFLTLLNISLSMFALYIFAITLLSELLSDKKNFIKNIKPKWYLEKRTRIKTLTRKNKALRDKINKKKKVQEGLEVITFNSNQLTISKIKEYL
jgi:hypothetical protein